MQQPVDRPDDTPQVKTKPTFWLRYSFWVFTTVYVIAITTGAIVLLVALGLAVVPQPVRTALQTWSIHNIFLKTDIVYVSPEAPEQSAVVSDKSNIENWLAECAHASSVFSLPGSVRNALEGDDKTAVSAQSSAPLLNHTAMRITRLTHDIGIARVAQAEKTQTFYVGEQVAIFITISLGLVTTILVAVSSADLFKRDSGRGIAIRVGAIAFPAIGTAVAALIAFYNPSASYGRASHALLPACLRRIEERGARDTAHRAMQNCYAVFRYAVTIGKAQSNPAAHLKGALPPARPGHFAATTAPEKVGPLLRKMLDVNATLPVKCALRLAPYSFCMPIELRTMRWHEVHLDAAEWRHIVGKTQTPHLVPLASQAVSTCS